MVIEPPDRSVERVSHERVILAPKAMSKKEANDLLKPPKNDLEYPANESSNQKDLFKTKKPKNASDNQTTESDSVDTTVPLDKTKQKIHKRGESADERDVKLNNKNDPPTEDFVIYRIVDHKINKDHRQRYSNVGDLLYRTRWYGFEANKET